MDNPPGVGVNPNPKVRVRFPTVVVEAVGLGDRVGRGTGRIGRLGEMRVGQCAGSVDWRPTLLILLRRVSRRRATTMRFRICVLFRVGPREALCLYRKVSRVAGQGSGWNVAGEGGSTCWPWEGGCAEMGTCAP